LRNDLLTESCKFTGQEAAKFILSRLVMDQNNIEKMRTDIDNNERLVSEIIDLFRDTEWVRWNGNGTYSITRKCEKVLNNVKFDDPDMP
jgi:hypothetical protein